MPFPAALGRLNKRGLNKLTVKLAGRGPFGELEHVGRRSGRAHRVPIMAFGPDAASTDGGPVITFALTYGPKVDWLRNARAAGSARLRLHGRLYTLGAPRDITTAVGMSRMEAFARPILKLNGVRQFVEFPVTDDAADPGGFSDPVRP